MCTCTSLLRREAVVSLTEVMEENGSYQNMHCNHHKLDGYHNDSCKGIIFPLVVVVSRFPCLLLET